MTAALTLGRLTTKQLLPVRRFIGFGLLGVAPALIYLISSGSATGSAKLEVFIGITTGVYFAVAVPVITLILSTSALGDERRDQTLSFVMLRPIPRWIIASSKLGAATVASFYLTGLGALALGAAYGLRESDWSYLLPLLFGGFVATAAYAALFVPLGYLAERSTLIGLAFVFVWENGIAGAIEALASTSPWRLGFIGFAGLAPAAVLDEVEGFVLGNLQPGAGGALVRLVVLVLLSVGATTYLLRYRDLT